MEVKCGDTVDTVIQTKEDGEEDPYPYLLCKIEKENQWLALEKMAKTFRGNCSFEKQIFFEENKRFRSLEDLIAARKSGSLKKWNEKWHEYIHVYTERLAHVSERDKYPEIR